MTDEDAVDAVVSAWRRERPDLDLTAIGVAGRMGRLALVLCPAQERVFGECGRQRGEFDVLAALRRSGPPYTLIPSELSKTLMLSRAGMTSRLDRLETAGFVEGAIDPNDQHSVCVRVHDKGFEAVGTPMTKHTASVSELLSGLSSGELGLLDDVLRKLLRGLDPQG